MGKKYDAIIVGGGHNGLVCAAYLAKSGRKVLVLEKRDILGGAAVTEEVFPGFKFSALSYVVSLFRPSIIRDLELPRHGMEVIPLETAFTPHLDGVGLCRWPDPSRSRREISRFSPKDAEAAPEFSIAMTQTSRFVRAFIDAPAPDPTSFALPDLLQLLRVGKSLTKGGASFLDLQTKLLTMSSADFLDRWFESDALKAPMAVSGIIGTFLGVRSPGTAYVLLHHYMGEIDGAFRSWGFSKGGTGQISLACARAAEEYGAEMRTGVPVQQVRIKNGRATGVVLENGDEVEARTVVSNCDPARIDRIPQFEGRDGTAHLRGDIAIAPSVDYLERAFDQAKYGEFSSRPYINMVIPSIMDPSVAPPGKHVVSMFVQYAPYHLASGPESWPEHREAFGDTVVDTVAEYCPGLRESILHRQVITPWDMEQEYGLTEGNIFHGELTLEQLLFQRPMAAWSRYRTPIKNLWMCGSGTHPGGGVMGAPGQQSALHLLKSGEV
jgi:phytoene dehydrogenase-like protein